MVQFFDSMYQLVDLWASDLKVSFFKFLDALFNNISHWCDRHKYWKFQPLEVVECAGAKFDEIKEVAREQMKHEEEMKQQAAKRVELEAAAARAQKPQLLSE